MGSPLATNDGIILPNPLDLIWQSYSTTQECIGVVRRSMDIGGQRDVVLRGSRLSNLGNTQILVALETAQDEIDDQTVLFLYATFEAAIRDRIAAKVGQLLQAAATITPFLRNLQRWFDDLSRESRMDKMVDVFSGSVDQILIAQAGTIRKYRHWLAHGRRGSALPSASPIFAYETLAEILRMCEFA